MDYEPYSPCPCGSGKKFKFCCMPIADQMDKVYRHLEHHQPRMALQVLEKVPARHQNNSWVLFTRAAVLLDEGEFAEARQTLEKLLEFAPDHYAAVALHAAAALSVDGFEAAREAIYDAIERCWQHCPAEVADLALAIASLMYGANRIMAARQYLTLAMRLAREEDRRQIFTRLLELDGEQQAPFPFRSVHQLASCRDLQEFEDRVRDAERMAYCGSWERAARVYSQLGEERPDNHAVWQNAGLCYAWAGLETEAADALHLAARLNPDEAAAVELETLAQLLDVANTEDCIPWNRIVYRVHSIARLLTRLDEQDRIIRQEMSLEDEDGEAAGPSAFVQILDRPMPATARDLSLHDVPESAADVMLFDRGSEEGGFARALLVGLEGPRFDEARSLFESAASGEAEFLEVDRDDSEAAVTPGMPRPLEMFASRGILPDDSSMLMRRRFHLQRWRSILDDVWPQTPQEALRGLTPREAAADPDLRRPLLAAVNVLDAYGERDSFPVSVSDVCRSLGVKPLGPVVVTPETQIGLLTSLELMRLPPERLSDAQLKVLVNRALLLRHSALMESVISEAAGRPHFLDEVEPERAYMILSQLTRERDDRDAAWQWLQRGKAAAERGDDFDSRMRWTLRELQFRLEDPGDPELTPLIERLRAFYAPKLEGFTQYLEQLCESYGVDVPWESTGGLAALEPAAAAGGLWTPGAAPERPAGETGKLWLPGQ